MRLEQESTEEGGKLARMRKQLEVAETAEQAANDAAAELAAAAEAFDQQRNLALHNVDIALRWVLGAGGRLDVPACTACTACTAQAGIL